MNEALFASIYVDRAPAGITDVVAALVDGTATGRAVDCAWARIAVDDDYGDFETRQRDPDDFLGWPTLLEVMPRDAASEELVVDRVRALVRGLRERGWRVLPQCDYAGQLTNHDD